MSDIDLEFTGDADDAPPVQHCSICGKPLSRYNNTESCFHHPDTGKVQRQVEREALRSRAVAKASQDELVAMAIQTNQASLARLAEEKLAEGEEERIRQDLIFDLVCQDFSVSRGEIIQSGRKTVFVEARQVLMYLLYNDTSLSYPTIGKLLGGRDHTTVIHGANKIETELQADRELSARVERLRSHYQRPD
jgi:chromosomal replication initiation ATPase DnaA